MSTGNHGGNGKGCLYSIVEIWANKRLFKWREMLGVLVTREKNNPLAFFGSTGKSNIQEKSEISKSASRLDTLGVW